MPFTPDRSNLSGSCTGSGGFNENSFLFHVSAAALQRYTACVALPAGAAGTGFYDLKFKAAALAVKHLALFHL
jgi:hypothetical protein